MILTCSKLSAYLLISLNIYGDQMHNDVLCILINSNCVLNGQRVIILSQSQKAALLAIKQSKLH